MRVVKFRSRFLVVIGSWRLHNIKDPILHLKRRQSHRLLHPFVLLSTYISLSAMPSSRSAGFADNSSSESGSDAFEEQLNSALEGLEGNAEAQRYLTVRCDFLNIL
jgi:hypothetical protein